MRESHEILGGKVKVYKRENSEHWQCSGYMAGRRFRKSTKVESLQLAKEFAKN